MLDTLKIEFSRGAIHHINRLAFQTVVVTDNVYGETNSSHLRVAPDVVRSTPGLTTFDIRDEVAILKVSAKILGSDYSKGIRLDTIDTVLRSVRKVGLCGIATKEFMDSAQVLACDVVRHVHVPDPAAALLKLAVLKLNEFYHFQQYDSGMAFRRKRLKPAERLTIYDKQQEVLCARSCYADPEQFRGILRCERNVKDFAGVREAFGIDNRKLVDILATRRNPVSETFERIAAPVAVDIAARRYEALLVRMYQGKDFRSANARLGYLAIFDACAWDWALVRSAVLAKYSGRSRPSRMLKQMRSLFLAEAARRGDVGTPLDVVAVVRSALALPYQ